MADNNTYIDDENDNGCYDRVQFELEGMVLEQIKRPLDLMRKMIASGQNEFTEVEEYLEFKIELPVELKARASVVAEKYHLPLDKIIEACLVVFIRTWETRHLD